MRIVSLSFQRPRARCAPAHRPGHSLRAQCRGAREAGGGGHARGERKTNAQSGSRKGKAATMINVRSVKPIKTIKQPIFQPCLPLPRHGDGRRSLSIMAWMQHHFSAAAIICGMIIILSRTASAFHTLPSKITLSRIGFYSTTLSAKTDNKDTISDFCQGTNEFW
jgi:hypothetical protein